MGYTFDQDPSVAHNVNRIFSQEVKAAIDSLLSPDGAKAETIHGVRKRIKKIRALFRLVRSELKPNVFNQYNQHYRTIGQTLSPLRDATVMINTLEKLGQTYPLRLSPQVLVTIRKALIRKQNQAASAFFNDPNQIEHLIDAFRQAPLKVAGLSGKRDGFSVLGPNLNQIYRRARKALQVATRKPSIDHFHELRKEVKTLWYHTRLLQPIWPGLFRAYGQELGRLGELLGDDHDLGIVTQEIESDGLLLPDQQTKELILQLLDEQRTQLQKQIHPLANRLLAEKADVFVKRYRLYWKQWQREAKKREFNRTEMTAR